MAKNKTPPTAISSDFESLEALFKLMNDHQMAEVTLEKKGGERLSVKAHVKGGGAQIYPSMVAPVVSGGGSPGFTQSGSESKGLSSNKLASNQKTVKSPFVGTFYRSAKPGAESYVKEGSQVKVGDVLCIIEAMKLMNEIESEVSGKVVSILVENGTPVEFGEDLFIIEI